MSQRNDDVKWELDELPAGSPVEITKGLSVRRKANGIPVLRLHYSAIPTRDPDTPEGANWYHQQKGDYPSAGDWDREQEIDDQAGGGELLLAPTLAKYADKIIISDPDWMPDPRWDCVEGFDHGKTNATCLLKCYIDFEGNKYLCGEYYNYRREDKPGAPGWGNEVWQNIAALNELHSLSRPRWSKADPSIFPDTQAQKDGSFSSLNSVYKEKGVRFLAPFEGERSDNTFIARVMEHWARLDEYAPSLYIVCRNDQGKRQPGLHRYDCPNLLWELRRAKRAELSDRQMMTRNPTENVVDKDNHARDAMKYLLMNLPRPTMVPLHEQFQAQIAETEERIGQILSPMSRAVAAQRFLSVGAGRPRQASVPLMRKGRMLR